MSHDRIFHRALRLASALLEALLLAVLALVRGATTNAQTTTDVLTGTIVDSSNAAIPSAQLSVVENTAGVVHATRSDESGTYVLPALPPGGFQ